MPVVAETPTSPADGAPIRPANAPPAPLAERLRRLRTARGWTLAQAAKACAVARSTLSKIENAQMSPTYELLLKLADGFGLGIGELLAADDAGPAHGGGRRSLARPGSGDGSQEFEFGGCAHRPLCADLAGKRMQPYLSRVLDPGAAPAGWSRHDGEEFLYVLAGRVQVLTEFYAPAELGPGEGCYLDSRMGHRVERLGDEEPRLLWIATRPQAGDAP